MSDGRTPQASFDPRTWQRTVPPGSTMPPTPPPASPPPAPPPHVDRTLPVSPIALGVSVAILLAGGLVAYASRPAQPATVATAPTPASTPTDAAAPRNERRMLVLSGRQDLEGALVASGVAPGPARAATAAAMPALKADGEIRAAMTLAPRAGGSACGPAARADDPCRAVRLPSAPQRRGLRRARRDRPRRPAPGTMAACPT